MSKLSHLIEMVITLQHKKLTTASELSDILEVDKKTIYRYIKTLASANVPIHTKKGRYGGFYIDEGFYMKLPSLTKEEMQALLMSSKILTKSNGFIYENQLMSAVEKIKRTCIDNNMDFDDLENSADFKIDNIGSMEKLNDKISKINYSISKGRAIIISYYSINKNKLTVRKVGPYTIIFKEGDWYVIGYCNVKDEVRTFKISRIKSIDNTSDIYMKPINFSLKEYLKNNWEVFTAGEQQVVIRFDKAAADFIKQSKWSANQQISDNLDGSIIFRIFVNELDEIKNWVMGFGSHAEVIAPDTLRNEIKYEIQELNKKYSNL
ncbi:YafY family protein [Clostridium sp. JN-9]|uniref:helix-turn-helix transcriptional regulator n=1 Tax=Clostridium sp. JN-9 TaxID=2507159 RepID=UPI000FFE1B72|nr:YafY family protein [Clostridium sp. JN-9]QAT39386.1 YafY family transcriptional regulator [Clostridium sp. JN-9]